MAHRDLKPENFIITEEFGLQLADFGFCTEILLNGQKKHSGCKGTLSYMAPEIIEAKNGYNPEQTDLFSLGVIFFSMYMGKPPFRQACAQKDELYRMLKDNKHAQFWKIWDEQYASPANIKLTTQFKQVFSAITSPDPNIRMSLSELKHHPWLWNARKAIIGPELLLVRKELEEIY